MEKEYYLYTGKLNRLTFSAIQGADTLLCMKEEDFEAEEAEEEGSLLSKEGRRASMEGKRQNTKSKTTKRDL